MIFYSSKIMLFEEKILATPEHQVPVGMWKLSLLAVLAIFAVCGEANPLKKKVCIIGAGLAGLRTARLLSLYPNEFKTVIFEKQSDVGGLWIYTNSTTVDEHGLPVHSSIYKNLRINFPKELEALPEYPEFKGNESQGSFVYHTEMLQYLKNYTEHFNIRQYIEFNTNVENVSPLPRMRWLVSTRNLKDKKRTETQCDAVIVAKGHHVKGHIPKLTGIESFSGQVFHSHVYRSPEVFANQTVVILGASYSGLDISIDISQFARKIYLSHRHDKLMVELPENVEQVLGVVGAEGSELILSDDSRIKADALILCTGYEYDFPFLDKSSGIYVDANGKWVRSLYKHLINIERPTMAIMNLPYPSLPFIVPRAQAAYFIAVLRGKVRLPARNEMLKDAALPPDVPKSKAHYMLEATLSYYDELASAGGDDIISDNYLFGVLSFSPYLSTDPWHFRDRKVVIDEDGNVELS